MRNPPLPIADGLNPSRVRVEHSGSARVIVRHLIDTQQHHDPTDDDTALRERFAEGLVRLDDGSNTSRQFPCYSFSYVLLIPKPTWLLGPGKN